MANPVIGLDLAIELAKAREQFRGLSESATPEARAIAREYGRTLRGIEAEAKKAGKATKKAADDTGGAWKKTGETLKAAAQASGFGDLAEKAGHLGTVASAAVSPVGLLAAGIVAAGTAAAGAAYAVVSVGAGLVQAGFGARAALTELEGFRKIGSDFFPRVPAETLASFDRLASTGEALDSIYDRLTVTVATSTAPAIDHLAAVVVGAALKASEMFEVWATGRNLLSDFHRFLVDSFIGSFRPAVDAVRMLGLAFVLVSDVMGRDVDPTLRAAVQSTDALKEAWIAADHASLGLIDSTGELAAKGRAFLDTQVRATGATKAQTVAVKENNDAEKERAALLAATQAQMDAGLAAADRIRAAGAAATTAGLSGEAAQRAALGHSLAELESWYAAERAALGAHNTAALGLDAEYAASREAIIASSQAKIAAIREADTAAATSAARSQTQAWLGVATATIQAAQTMSSAFARTYDTTTAAGKAAAKHQWKTQHAISIATTAALAVVALAQAAGSAPYPANVPAMIAAGISGAAQVAAVAAIQPSYHRGGLAPDETRATVQPGEEVVSKQGVSTKFRSNGSRANAGVSGGPMVIQVEQRIRHQVVDRVVSEVLDRGGQTQRAVAGMSGSNVPFGHRKDTWRR